MKVWRVYCPLVGNARFASTHWRHVESPAPIPRQIFKNDALPNTPTLNIRIGEMIAEKIVTSEVRFDNFSVSYYLSFYLI